MLTGAFLCLLASDASLFFMVCFFFALPTSLVPLKRWKNLDCLGQLVDVQCLIGIATDQRLKGREQVCEEDCFFILLTNSLQPRGLPGFLPCNWSTIHHQELT